MNHPTVHHSASSQTDIRLRLEPSDESGGFTVEFVTSTTLRDVQYVLELSEDSPAKFTSPPRHGGIGCNDSRVYGRPGDSPAILKINDDAPRDSRVEIRGGWATGHEAVTLVEPVVMTVGEDLFEDGADDAVDDAYEDDQAEAEHEEGIIEEEREEMEEEIEEAEQDVIEALEEKRMEDTHDSADINEAEQEVVEALEEKRKEMDKALNSLKDEIIIEKAHNVDMHEAKMAEMHRTEKEREEIRKQRAEEIKRKHHGVDQQLNHMEHHMKDAQMKAKLEHFKKMREDFKDNEEILRAIDRQEHLQAESEHHAIKKEEVNIDTEHIKEVVHKHQMEQHQQRVQRSGVHEMMNNRDVKLVVDKLKGHIKKGLPRGGEAFHGEVGEPLSSEARNGLLGMFGVVILVGVVRWGLDKRRRGRKQHTV